MTVELWYDPVYTEIKTKINKTWQNHEDIFGFLYPVRSYPLQTWLKEVGSWEGLGRQLCDLARGETVRFIFHGRLVDYQDVQTTLVEYPTIRTEFHAWDTEQIYTQKIQKLTDYLNEHPFPVKEKIAELKSLLTIPETEMEWILHIDSDVDWEKAEMSMCPCIVLGKNYPISYCTLHQLEKLTKSLRRPAEAIFCQFQDNEQKQIMQDYAAQFHGMQFSFLLSTELNALDKMRKKYGRPYCLRQKITAVSKKQENFKIALSEWENSSRKSDLYFKRQDSHLTRNEILELDMLQQISSWIYTAENWIDEMENLPYCHAIKSLEGGIQ